MAYEKRVVIDSIQDVYIAYDTDTGDIVYFKGSTELGRLTDAGAFTATTSTPALSGEARGALMAYGASGWEALDASSSGQILVGDGTDIASVAVSGDVALSSAGAVTIADPYKMRTNTITLNNDGTGADGAIVGTGAGSMGHSSGVTLVPAVAGYVIIPQFFVGVYTFDTAAYTTSGAASIYVVTPTENDTLGPAQAATDFLAHGDNTILIYPCYLPGRFTANEGPIIRTSTGSYTDPGTAAGTATITTYYRLQAVS